MAFIPPHIDCNITPDDLTQSSLNTNKILSVTDSIVGDAHGWSSIDQSTLKVTHIKGGITNLLCLIQASSTNSSNPPKPLLFRIFGDKSDIFIDRNIDNQLMMELSHLGVGPTL